MRVYVAAPYPEREKALTWANWLDANGHECTARWVRFDEDSPLPTDQRNYAEIDIADIDAADTVILMTGYRGDRSWTGGRHFETGYAWAKGKRIVVCGPRESVFHHMLGVVHIDRVEDFT